MEHDQLLSDPVPRNSVETCVSSFPGLILNLLMNDWRFVGLTERVRFLFSPNLWLFRGANPKVWMIWLFAQLRTFPRLRYFRVTFYRLPDISKIHDLHYPCKYFRSFVLTMYQPWLSTIVNNFYWIIWLLYSVLWNVCQLNEVSNQPLHPFFAFFILI